MKKITILLLSLFLTITSFSQEISRVVRSTKLEWNGEKWLKIAEEYPKELFVILKDYDLTIGKYKFKTYDKYEKSYYDEHITFTWKCINGNGEKCVFMMKVFKPEITSHLIYSIVYDTGVMYEYEIEQ